MPPSRSGPLMLRASPVRPQTDPARWSVVWLLCGLSVVFWLTAQQSGSSLVAFAESHTERSIVAFGRTVQIGPGHFALHGLQVLLRCCRCCWAACRLRRHKAEPSTLAKMTLGLYVATAAAFVVLVFAGLHGDDTQRQPNLVERCIRAAVGGRAVAPLAWR